MRAGLVVASACLVLGACGKDEKCWAPNSSLESDKAILQAIASPDLQMQAAGYAQRVERCIDRAANNYGRGRDAAPVVAEAVVEECRSDIETQASLEAPSPEDISIHVQDKLAYAKRRALILIVRDRASGCI